MINILAFKYSSQELSFNEFSFGKPPRKSKDINKEFDTHDYLYPVDDEQKYESHGIWYDILSGGKKVGDMTCGVWSKRLEKNIGFALISVDFSSGNEVKVLKSNRKINAQLVNLPFI